MWKPLSGNVGVKGQLVNQAAHSILAVIGSPQVWTIPLMFAPPQTLSQSRNLTL